MNISAFSNYKVLFKNEYSYISDYDYNEPNYTTEIEEWEKEMDGGALMNFISKLLSDKETISITSNGNTVYIDTFCPHNGTGADMLIKYEEIGNRSKEDEKEDEEK